MRRLVFSVTAVVLLTVGLASASATHTTYLPTVSQECVIVAPTAMPAPVPWDDLRDGSFEEQANEWVTDPITANIISTLPILPHGGAFGAQLGGMVGKTEIRQRITLQNSQTMHFWYWVSSNEACGTPSTMTLSLVMENKTVILDVFPLCASSSTSGWTRSATYGLQNYTNVSAELVFTVNGKEETTNFFLDDVRVEP